MAIVETEIIHSKENAASARDRMIEKYGKLRGLWEIFSYDEDGYLCLRDPNGKDETRIIDFAKFENTPFQLVDLRRQQDRVRKWMNLANEVAQRVEYKGKQKMVYAMKVDDSAGMAKGAEAVGCGLECSSPVDVLAINWMVDRSVINGNNLFIFNGLMLPDEIQEELSDTPPAGYKTFPMPGNTGRDRIHDESYIEMITSLALQIQQKGGVAVPVIDSESVLNILGQKGETPPGGLDVGLRFKLYGKATNDGEQSRLVARHGMDWESLKDVADKIADIAHLRLTMFHAMVSAAGSIQVDDFVNTLHYSVDKFLLLKEKHPGLYYFNMGGGMEPFSSDYGHEEFLEKFLTGLKDKAEEHGLNHEDGMCVVYEFGSLIAADAGHHILTVDHVKSNSVDEKGEPEWWYNIDGSILRMIPDIEFLDGITFPILPANLANRTAVDVRLGDLTCDNGSRYPTKFQERNGEIVWMPVIENGERLVIVIACDKAYGEQLSGAGIESAGHSGQKQPGTLIIFRDKDGNNRIFREQRQTFRDMMRVFGYTDSQIGYLRSITDFKRTPDFQSGGELNSDMSSTLEETPS